MNKVSQKHNASLLERPNKKGMIVFCYPSLRLELKKKSIIDKEVKVYNLMKVVYLMCYSPMMKNSQYATLL